MIRSLALAHVFPSRCALRHVPREDERRRRDRRVHPRYHLAWWPCRATRSLVGC